MELRDIYPDDLAPVVNQRPAAVAGISRGVRFQAFHLIVVFAQPDAVFYCRNDTGRDGYFFIHVSRQGIAQRSYRIAEAGAALRGELQHG